MQDTNKPSLVRWDVLCACYLIGLSMVVMAFGMNNTPHFNKLVLAGANLHFAGEIPINLHFVFPANVGRVLTIITWIILVVAAIVQMLPSTTYFMARVIFGILVFISDGSNLVCPALCVLTPGVNPVIQRLAFVCAMHQAGFLLVLINNTVRLFSETLAPVVGAGWMMMGLIGAFQLYIMRPFLRKEFNHLTPTYVSWHYWVAPLLIVLFDVANMIPVAFRTTPTDTLDARLYAVGFWNPLIIFVGAPITMLIVGFVIYYLVVPVTAKLDGSEGMTSGNPAQVAVELAE